MFQNDDDGLYLEQVLGIVDAYQSHIDWAVREQLDDVLMGDDAATKNPNALRYIKEFLNDPRVANVLMPEELEDGLAMFEVDDD